MTPARLLLCLALASVLGACGFQLRGAQTLPYQRIYLDLPEHAEMTADLRRAIATTSTEVVTERKNAEAVFSTSGEIRDKAILSLNSAGRAREFQLRYRYSYRVTDTAGRNLSAPGEINLTRDFSFDDAQVLAKEQEEALLWRDMQKDLVQQLLRRLAAAKPVTP
jgi:LPS-assembly lipoprotein